MAHLGKIVPASLAQLEAIRLVGGVEVMRDGVLLAEPAYGKAMIDKFLSAAREQDDELAMRVMHDANMTQKQRVVFGKYNRVVRMDGHENGIPEVIQSIPGLTTLPLDEYDMDVDPYVGGIIDDSEKRYQLHAVFADEHVAHKLQISSRVVQLAKRLSVSSASQAAGVLTEYLRGHGYPNYRVLPGEFLRSRAHCQNMIHEMAKLIQYTDNTIPSLTTHKQIRMTYSEFGQDLPEWTVEAPLRYAVEAQCVYQLAIHHGPEHLLFLLAAETQSLDIQIYNEKERRYFTGSLVGYSSMEGVDPIGVTYPADMSSVDKARLFAAARKVVPVMSDMGRVVGSAIRVTDRHAIVNAHTLTNAAEVSQRLSVAGADISDRVVVGDDIIAFQSDAPESIQWPLREPRVGEKVVLCYSVGDTVEYSEVLHVLALTGSFMSLSDSAVMRPGTSGAAVVSLSDFSLLGMFVTGYRAARATIFRSRYLLDIVDADTKSQLTEETGSIGDSTYDHMVRHGLSGYLGILDQSVAPLYSEGRLTGTLVNYGQSWVAARSAGLTSRMISAAPIRWSVDEDCVVAEAMPGVLSALPHKRKPSNYESACIFVKDQQGVVMSAIVSVVYDDSDDKCYSLYGFPATLAPLLSKGVVVSTTDGAFLGHVVRAVTSDVSTSFRCKPPVVATSDRSENGMVEFLQDLRVSSVLSSTYDVAEESLLRHVGASIFAAQASSERRVIVTADTLTQTVCYSQMFKLLKSVNASSQVEFANAVDKYLVLVGLAAGYDSRVAETLVSTVLGEVVDDNLPTPTRRSFVKDKLAEPG